MSEDTVEIERQMAFVKMAWKRFVTIVLSRECYNGVRSKRRRRREEIFGERCLPRKLLAAQFLRALSLAECSWLTLCLGALLKLSTVNVLILFVPSPARLCLCVV